MCHPRPLLPQPGELLLALVGGGPFGGELGRLDAEGVEGPLKLGDGLPLQGQGGCQPAMLVGAHGLGPFLAGLEVPGGRGDVEGAFALGQQRLLDHLLVQVGRLVQMGGDVVVELAGDGAQVLRGDPAVVHQAGVDPGVAHHAGAAGLLVGGLQVGQLLQPVLPGAEALEVLLDLLLAGRCCGRRTSA